MHLVVNLCLLVFVFVAVRIEYALQQGLSETVSLFLALLRILQLRVDPLLELAVVDEDLVRNGPEVLQEGEDVLALHLVAIVVAENVIELLLSNKAVSVGVDLPNGQGYLL